MRFASALFSLAISFAVSACSTPTDELPLGAATEFSSSSGTTSEPCSLDGTGDPGTSTGEAGVCDVPGTGMAPCANGVCVGNLVCVLADNGSFCAPPCAECEGGQWDMCIEELTEQDQFTCKAGVGCLLPCDSPDDCKDGMGCHAIEHLCMWPINNPVKAEASRLPPCVPFVASEVAGARGGPCLNGTCEPGSYCVSGDVGNVCMGANVCHDACTVAEGCGKLHPLMLCDPSLSPRTCVW